MNTNNNKELDDDDNNNNDDDDLESSEDQQINRSSCLNTDGSSFKHLSQSDRNSEFKALNVNIVKYFHSFKIVFTFFNQN